MFIENEKIRSIRLTLVVLVMALSPFSSSRDIQNNQDSPKFMSALPQGTASSRNFSIIGEDDRFEITKTVPFPWSAVALIRNYWTADDPLGTACTGWMVGPSTLATAAHCIYDKGYAHHVTIKPAFNSDAREQTPYGTCGVIDGVVPDAWKQNHSIEADYGVYHLDCAIGEKTGTLGFKVTSGDRVQKAVQLTGYPADKQLRTMWSGYGKVTSATARGFYYDIDTAPGQSGGPVWDYTDTRCNYCVVAINSSQFSSLAQNYGVRINEEVFRFLMSQRSFHTTK